MNKTSPGYRLVITAILFNAMIVSPSFAASKAKVVKPQMAGRTAVTPSNTILNGTGAPKTSLGINGDFYIDTKVMNFYGPKTNGHWPIAINLRGRTGLTGAAGTSGNNGKSGANVLAAGPQGSPGATGPKGDVGATGAKSEIGATGAKGEIGASGSAGLSGIKGDTGSPGSAGSPGAKGETGASGFPGATGNAGANGVQGPIGATGLAGATGSQGPIGATGLAGATGSQGPIGATGLAGATGLQGLSGAQGLQGNPGATGAGGANGATGPSNLYVIPISIWTLSTSSAGTGSDSVAFGNLVAGKSYKVSIIVHGVQRTANSYFGAELRLTSIDSSASYEIAVIDNRYYASSSYLHRYTFIIEGTVVVGATNTSLVVRVIDGAGVTGGVESMTLSGRANLQLVGQVS
jgi:hypothetical protein